MIRRASGLAGIAGCGARHALTGRHQPASNRELGKSDPPREGATMTKRLIYMASIALIGLMGREASAAPAAWRSGIAGDIAAATANAADAPPVCQRGGGRGGGGYRGGGGGGYRGGGYRGGGGGGFNRGGAAAGGSWAGVSGGNRGNFNSANVNRGNFNTANINR